MKSPKFILALLLLFTLEGGNSNKIDHNELMKRVEEDINNEVREMMKLGARSKRFVHKKITPV